MNIDEMDAEADNILESWADPSKDIEIGRLNEVYGAMLTPDLWGAYGWEIGRFVIVYGAEKGVDYLLPKVKTAVKQVYHDLTAGKAAPTKKEFRRILLSGSINARAIVKGTLTVTHADGSVD